MSNTRIDFGWGLNSLRRRGLGAEVAVIVDVLSFCTAIDAALSQGAKVTACWWDQERAKRVAEESSALLAGHRGSEYSLSPESLLKLEEGETIVLPSPNGSMLSLESPARHTLCASLRNAAAVARFAASLGGRICVIAAGERWPDESLRPGLEDMLGAGAVIDALTEASAFQPSAPAQAARAVFMTHRNDVLAALNDCPSGQELIDRGFPHDVEFASQLNVSTTVPVLEQDTYVNAQMTS